MTDRAKLPEWTFAGAPGLEAPCVPYHVVVHLAAALLTKDGFGSAREFDEFGGVEIFGEIDDIEEPWFDVDWIERKYGLGESKP